MIKVFLPLLILLLIAGCGEDEQRPPIIFSIDTEPKVVSPGGKSVVIVKAGDPDKDKISYLWTASGGVIQGDSGTVEWIAPQAEGKYELTVTVSDGLNSVTEAVIVRVWNVRPGDYYPLKVGNKWTFRDNEDNSINFEVIDTIDISGTEAFVKQTTTSGHEGAVNFSYVSKGENGITQHALGGASAGNDTIIFTPPLLLYKFPLIPEESWEVKFDVKVPDGYFVGSGKAIYEVISEEELTVGAGTFQHVFQVKEDFLWEIFDQELDHTISHQWLAPDVGLVKFVQEQTRGGETVIIEATLQSYSLK